MKRLLGLLCTLCLLAGAAAPASAAGQAEAVAAFCQGNRLYTWLTLPEETWPEGLRAEARVGGEPAYPADPPGPAPVAERAGPVSWLLLIDTSTSMPAFQGGVERFAAALPEGAGEGAAWAVAAFGEGFRLVQDYTADADVFLQAVKGLSYGANQTSLYRGLMDALDFLDARTRAEGELVNLVIVTDGIEVDKNGPTQLEVAGRISAAAPVLIHTLGLASSQAESEEALKVLGSFARATSGRHTVLERGGEAEGPAGEIMGYVNGLCALSFTLSLHKMDGQPIAAQLVFSTPDALLYQVAREDIPTLDAPGGAQETQPPAPTSGGEPAAPPTAAEPPAEGLIPGESPPPGESLQPVTASPAPESGEPPRAPGGVPVWAFAAGGAALAAAGLAAVLLLRQRRGKTGRAPSPNAVFMKLEVLSGTCATAQREFYLSGELIVGRGRGCDIPWKNREVDARNTRIFLREHVVYVEDLGSSGGTALGGMRLHGANRLRSGDEISIGPVRFTLKF